MKLALNLNPRWGTLRFCRWNSLRIKKELNDLKSDYSSMYVLHMAHNILLTSSCMYYCKYWQKSWVLTSARLWHWLWVRGLWRSCCLPGTPGRSMGAWQRRRPRWWGGSDGTDAGCQPTRGCSASAWLQPVTLPPTSSTTTLKTTLSQVHRGGAVISSWKKR